MTSISVWLKVWENMYNDTKGNICSKQEHGKCLRVLAKRVLRT